MLDIVGWKDLLGTIPVRVLGAGHRKYDVGRQEQNTTNYNDIVSTCATDHKSVIIPMKTI